MVGPQSRTLVGLRGPSGIWLYSRVLGERVRAVNQYLRFLVIARELDNQFEWTAHEPAALGEGLSQEIIVKYRRPAGELGADESVIVAFGREVFRERKVSAGTFAQAVERVGHEGVVNLAAFHGQLRDDGRDAERRRSACAPRAPAAPSAPLIRRPRAIP